MINKEKALKIANILNLFNSSIYWDNDEEKWYLDNEQVLDDIQSLAEYVIKQNMDEVNIINKLIDEGLNSEDIQKTYERYLENIEVCKDLIEKDMPKQVIKTDATSQACPVCQTKVSITNGFYCSNCGQKLDYGWNL